jgi:hypothetical protein
MPYVDTMLRLLPLGRARAAAPDWHIGRGFFGEYHSPLLRVCAPIRCSMLCPFWRLNLKRC